MNIEKIQSLLDSADYATALSAVLSEADQKKKKSTVASRKKALAKAVEEYDVEVMANLQTQMQDYIDRMAQVEVTEPRELTKQEQVSLMSEFIDMRAIAEFLDSRKETIRELVFAHITEENERKGVENPDITPGKIEVPELGKSFCREGGGTKPPALDERKLAELLGDDADEVFEVEIIPEQRNYTLSEEKLMKLAQERPEIMEKIRESLIPGGIKSSRFVVRDKK